MTINFTSGPATIVDPHYIKYINPNRGVIDGYKSIQISTDHRLWLSGEFQNFRLYCLVNHSRVEIEPNSVQVISDTKFRAVIRLIHMEKHVEEQQAVTFQAPFQFKDIRVVNYGLSPDSFEFSNGVNRQVFICDLTFLTKYGCDFSPIPLEVKYIGIAKAEKREAQDRLGEGHSKLQDLLAEHNRRPSRFTTSVVLYRPSELVPPLLAFPDVIETIEASMIQYFKPIPLNERRIYFPSDSPDLKAKLHAIRVSKIQLKLESPKGTRLFSKKVDPDETHFIEVKLK